MEIWLDTSDVDVVASSSRLGILRGVTTNPSILAQSKICPQETICKLLEAQPGLLAVQVLSDDVEAMYHEAKSLSAISDRIVVKIPVTRSGIQVIHALDREGIPTLATAIFELRQALVAFKAGASYLAPYLSRIAAVGQNPIQVISKMHAMKSHYGFKGKIMGAAIRELSTALACLDIGICAITLPENLFAELIEDEQHTLVALKKFALDWEKRTLTTSNH